MAIYEPVIDLLIGVRIRFALMFCFAATSWMTAATNACVENFIFDGAFHCGATWFR
jgi:hypothetical protein